MQQVASAVASFSAARQEGISRENQLTPGTIITGVVFETVRVIERIEGGHVFTSQIHPRLAATPPTHTHSFTLNNSCACVCGMRRDPIAVFMPGTTSGWIKTFAIHPEGTLAQLSPNTLYVQVGPGSPETAPLGSTISTGVGLWGSDLPIIQRLAKVWELPEALKAILAERG